MSINANNNNSVSRDVLMKCVQSAAGAAIISPLFVINAVLFTAINPVAGAVYGVISYLSNGVTYYISDSVIDSSPSNHPILNVLKVALKVIIVWFGSLFASVGLGVAVAGLLGFPIAFKAALTLSLITIATMIPIARVYAVTRRAMNGV